jgi:hypothetical protein
MMNQHERCLWTKKKNDIWTFVRGITNSCFIVDEGWRDVLKINYAIVKIPIVPVLIEGGGYNFEEAIKHLK